VFDLKLSVEQVESNPQLVQIVPPNEVVVLISFEITIGELRGMMNLCIPYNSIERIGGKLSANTWVTYGHRQATSESVEQISRAVCTSQVELNVRLSQTRITASELLGLRVGDIITTAKDINSPMVVLLEGIPKFHASPGAFKGHKAILITDAIKNPTVALE
jgi:flagellar motor switch protein FliM